MSTTRQPTARRPPAPLLSTGVASGSSSRPRTPLKSATLGATSSSSTGIPKKGLTLEEWEQKTVLGTEEVKSVNLVKEFCERKPLPLKVCSVDIIWDGY
jgi:hypothetical protein